MSRQVIIEFLGKDKSLGKTSDQVRGKTSRLSSTLQKVGAVAGKALAAGAVAGAVGLYKLSQGAADDEQAQVKLAASLRQAAGATDEQIASVERWITAQGKALGVTDDELRPALTKLADATGSVTKAQDLVSIAMDTSVATGKDLNTIVEALVRAQNGSVGGLSRLGVATRKANGDMMTFSEVTKNLAELHGGRAAKAAETNAGKQKILQVQLAELGEEIGGRVLPFMLKLTEAGLKMVDWVGRNQTTVGVLVGGLAALAAVTWAVGAAIKAWTAITKIWTAAQIIATNVQWALNVAMSANPIGLVVLALAALTAGVIIAYKKSETFRKIVHGAFGVVLKIASAVLGFFKRNWPAIVTILTGPIGLAVRLIIGSFDKIRDAGARVVGWVKDIPGKIRRLGGIFKDVGRFLIDQFIDGLKRAAGVIGGIAGSVWGALRTLLNGAIDKINSALEFTIDVPFGPSFNINPRNIPHLARGTRNWRGGTALVGEAGPELVTLPRGANVLPAGPTRAALGGGGMLLPLTIQLDGRNLWQGLLKVRQDLRVPLGLG